jgi:hypothetical protein
MTFLTRRQIISEVDKASLKNHESIANVYAELWSNKMWEAPVHIRNVQVSKVSCNVKLYSTSSVSLEMVSRSELKRFGPPEPRKLSWKWTRQVQPLKRSNCCPENCATEVSRTGAMETRKKYCTSVRCTPFRNIKVSKRVLRNLYSYTQTNDFNLFYSSSRFNTEHV